MKYFYLTVLLMLSVSSSLYSQEMKPGMLVLPSTKPYVDSTDLQEIVFGKDESDTSSGLPAKGEFIYFILPLIVMFDAYLLMNCCPKLSAYLSCQLDNRGLLTILVVPLAFSSFT